MNSNMRADATNYSTVSNDSPSAAEENEFHQPPLMPQRPSSSLPLPLPVHSPVVHASSSSSPISRAVPSFSQYPRKRSFSANMDTHYTTYDSCLYQYSPNHNHNTGDYNTHPPYLTNRNVKVNIHNNMNKSFDTNTNVHTAGGMSLNSNHQSFHHTPTKPNTNNNHVNVAMPVSHIAIPPLSPTQSQFQPLCNDPPPSSFTNHSGNSGYGFSSSLTHHNHNNHHHSHPQITIPTFQNRRRAFSNSEVRKSKDGNLTLIIRPHHHQRHGRSNASSFDSFDSIPSIPSNGTNHTTLSEEDGNEKRLKQSYTPHRRLPRKLCVRQNTPTRDIPIESQYDCQISNSFPSLSTKSNNPSNRHHASFGTTNNYTSNPITLHSPKTKNKHNHTTTTHCNLSMSNPANIQIPNFKSRRRMNMNASSMNITTNNTTQSSCTNRNLKLNASESNACYNTSHVNGNHVIFVPKGKHRFTRWFATVAVCCILFYTKTFHHDEEFNHLNRLEHPEEQALLSSRLHHVSGRLKQGQKEENLNEGSGLFMGEKEMQTQVEGKGLASDPTLKATIASKSSSSTTTTSTTSTSTNLKKKLRQPQLAQANSLTTQSQSTNFQIPQPIRTELVLTENEIQKIDSVLTDGRQRKRHAHSHSHSNYSNGVTVGGLILKPIHYFAALGCLSLMVILVESYFRDRRNCR